MAHETELTEFLVAQFATFRAEYRDDNKRIHDRIDSVINELQQVKKELSEVKVQTTKTNGRVNGLETHIKECPVVNVIKDIDQAKKDIVAIQASEKVKLSEEYKSGKWLKQAAVVAGYIVGISAVFGGLIYIKDLL